VAVLKRMLVGRPLANVQMEHQRITKRIALAVFSSDAISSTAYATEEILFVVAFGTSSLALGLSRLVPISIAVAILLIIVVSSYRRTIFAYPQGGGSYVVSRENLGVNASLTAGAAMLIDYTLTVAVSISAGVAALLSIPVFESLQGHRVELGLVLIALITLVNLRGVKESGRVFAFPTYLYIGLLVLLIGYGLIRYYTGDVGEIDASAFEGRLTGGELSLFILLKGFSSGAVALTGVEAIADGVPVFRRPEARNAAATLVAMAVILGTLFFGTALLASKLGPYPTEDQTILAQMSLAVFGSGPVFLLLQFATAAILVLAANTAYADFPRLSSIIARDGFLPRQLANRGDRLVFSNGVLVLALGAGALLIAFGGITSVLIPLYAVGVFTSFTLSQAGMLRLTRSERGPGWRKKAAISGFGSIVTFVIVLIVAITKFKDGAWVPLVVIPIVIVFFKVVKAHYASVAEGLRTQPGYRTRKMNHTMVVLVSGVHRGVLEALAYAKSLHPSQLLAMTVVSDEEEQDRITAAWAQYGIDVPLQIICAPYRELTRPVLRYVDELDAQRENDVVTIVIPEFVVGSWWSQFLHNQSALLLKARLLFRKGTVVTSVPYHLE